MSRWEAVYGETFLGTGWIAQPKEEGLGAIFDTWAEAFDHADRMARTVPTALPRTINKIISPSRGIVPIMTVEVGPNIGMRRGANYIAVSEEELEPLAVTLLAKHHKNQRGKREQMGDQFTDYGHIGPGLGEVAL